MKKVIIVVLTLAWCLSSFSQQPDNNLLVTISGKVSDVAANNIPGASIRLLNTNNGAVTDSKGEFIIYKVYSGTYSIEVSASGYATIIQPLNASFNNAPILITMQLSLKTLDAVIVTAQKTEERLQEIPISITSLSAKQLEEYRLWNSKDIAAIVPNMYAADPGDKRNVFSLRGIATTSYDPAMATYIDGVNQFSLDTYIAQLFDVERIEILRGAQGTLYGRNAMAGVMNIVTRQTGNKMNAFAEITEGSDGLQRYSAGIRTPIIKDKLYIGVAGLYDRSNGFYFNQFNNTDFDKQRSLTGNFYLKYLPADKWAVSLNVKANNNWNMGTFPLVVGVEEALKNPFKLSQNATSNLSDNIFNASLSANYSGRNFTFSTQTAYQSNYRFYDDPIDGDFSPIDGITIINNYGKDWNNVKVLTQEFKFTSPAAVKNNFRWTAGAYFFHQDNPTKQAVHFGEDGALVGAPDNNISLINSTRASSKGMAIYAQGTYVLNKKFELTAGLRYDGENRKQSILGEYQKDPDPTPIFAYRPDTSASADFQAVSPKLTAVYKFTNHQMVFANYSKGFRAGGLTPISSDPSQPALYPYKPEYSNNFEIGLKNTFFNNRLLLNVTAFYTTVNDAQVPTLVLPDAVTITKNTGELTSKGIELETHGLFDGFQFDYNFGYTNAAFKSLQLSQGGAAVNLNGNKQIFTPDVTSLLAVQYGITISKKQQFKMTVRGEWRYIGKQYFDLANTIAQPSYSLLNSSIVFSLHRLTISFWGRNLANKNYISYGYDFGAVRLGDPKVYGISFGCKL